TEAHGTLPARKPVRVRPARVRALLGYEVADDFIGEALRRLHCTVARDGHDFRVTAPSWRFDLAIEEDFVEEVARVHGYEHVPAGAPRSSLPMLPAQEGARSRFDLKRAAAALGYQEVINYSFVPSQWEEDFAGNAAAVRLANPIASTMDVMRSTLVGGLVAAVKANLNRDEPRVRLFEIGRCFLGQGPEPHEQPERLAGITYGTRLPEQWAEKTPGADFFDAKGDLEAIAGTVKLAFRRASHPAFHPGRCARVLAGDREVGVVGELHPRLQLKYELAAAPVLFEIDCAVLLAGRAPRFEGVSRMPTVRRDLAVVVADDLAVGAILEAVRASLPPVVREVEVFDQYRGKGVENGRKSLAFRIVMQDTARTLTDAEVEEIVGSVRHLLTQKFQALPRT
ncbi:MAG: phenylalanine--tRNA ligase subunit beta, partial [Burkholderiales bacterium]|nr:phenylalanine--tRNA ligase subunit beta [Burkholderiales bacterium]